MRWKRVAWAGCLTPVLGGCNIAHYTAQTLINEPLVHHTQHGIEHQIHRDAKAAWQEVRCQYPRSMFTHEFRDGFMDGYSDYLDRGGNAQPPAVPPAKYTRHKKYFTPEGHALIKDYYLGFKYGVDVAVATGQRQFLTVPVLLPEKTNALPTFDIPTEPGTTAPTIPPAIPPIPTMTTVPPSVPVPMPAPPAPSAPPTVKPLPSPRQLPPPGTPPQSSIPGYSLPTWRDPGDPTRLNAPTLVRTAPAETDMAKFRSPAQSATLPGPGEPAVLPIPRAPLPASDPGGTKFDPIAPRPDPDALPRPDPPLPTDVNVPVPLPVPPRPDVKVKLPAPPVEVPNLPDGLPTPPVWDDIPIIPPSHVTPQPLPPSLSVPNQK